MVANCHKASFTVSRFTRILGAAKHQHYWYTSIGLGTVATGGVVLLPAYEACQRERFVFSYENHPCWKHGYIN